MKALRRFSTIMLCVGVLLLMQKLRSDAQGEKNESNASSALADTNGTLTLRPENRRADKGSLFIDTLDFYSPYQEKTIYYYPVIRWECVPRVADSINHHLVRYLGVEPGTESVNIFEKIIPRPYHGVVDVSFTVQARNDRYINLRIESESCGANCKRGDDGLNYDLYTGRFIELPDLFTTEGERLMIDSLRTYTRRRITSFIAQLKAKLDDPREDPDIIAETILIYEGCNWLDEEWGPFDREGFLNEVDISISDDGITTTLDRCSAHVNRALDELWEHEYIVDIKQWKKHLSPYGRLVLNVH